MMRWGDIHDQLFELLGEDALRKLVEAYGGRRIHVPTRVHETREQRTDRVIEALKTGATYKQAAEEIGVHQSTVFRRANRG